VPAPASRVDALSSLVCQLADLVNVLLQCTVAAQDDGTWAGRCSVLPCTCARRGCDQPTSPTKKLVPVVPACRRPAPAPLSLSTSCAYEYFIRPRPVRLTRSCTCPGSVARFSSLLSHGAARVWVCVREGGGSVRAGGKARGIGQRHPLDLGDLAQEPPCFRRCHVGDRVDERRQVGTSGAAVSVPTAVGGGAGSERASEVGGGCEPAFPSEAAKEGRRRP
jgi:hypothetical protein